MNCPHCDQLIYSRQRKRCDFCGKELPPECRLTEDEIEDLHEKLEVVAERRAAFKAKEEEERIERAKRAGGDAGAGMILG